MIPHYGTAVVGNQRYPRPEITEKICQAVTTGNGVRIFGLRRIGKSTQVKHALETLSKRGIENAWVDLQGCCSEAELLFGILRELPATGIGIGASISKAILGDNAVATGVREAIRSYDQGKLGDVEAYFNTVSKIIETTLSKIEANPSGVKLVIAMDEFPWLCRNILESDEKEGRQRVNRLLASLRKWRDQGMRMILLGSIGMTSLGRKHQLQLDHLNDAPPQTIAPLESKNRARDFLNQLVLGSGIEEWTETHTEKTINESVALYPSMIQRAFQSLHRSSTAVAPHEIELIFAETIRPDLDLDFFDQFDRRLKQNESADEGWGEVVREIQKLVLAATDGIARRDIQTHIGDLLDASDLGDVLNALREDGFIDVRIERDGTQIYRPASPLVLAWYRSRQGV